VTKLNGHSDFDGIVRLIEEARGRALRKVNEELVLLYFKVGEIVSERVAQGVWGENTVGELADHIRDRLPGSSGFTRRGLYRMKQFYEKYAPDSECFLCWRELMNTKPNTSAKGVKNGPDPIVSTLLTQLGNTENHHDKFVSTLLTQLPWSAHLHILAKTRTAEESLFYLMLSIKDRLSVREIERQLNTAVYERTMLSEKNVSALPTQLPQGLFRDPYIFEFLDLPDGHTEKDLESALVMNLQKFILEIGQGFTYMGRQYRIQVGNKDYRTDLLFYHRDLQCLVLFEMKIREFEPEFLGKLDFYLEALDRDVKRPHEHPSIGILLCKGKDSEVVRYSMARSTSPAMIADYETKLIPKQLLADKLHQLAEEFSSKTFD